MRPKYTIGTTVFQPWASTYTRKEIPCTICAGQRFVTLILGTGEHQQIECGACGRVGMDPASGVEHIYVADYGVNVGTITGLSLRNDVWWYEINNGSSITEDDVWTVPGAAALHAHDVLFAVAQRQRQEQFESNCLGKKRKLTWSAHYHRSALARLRREAEYHERILLDPRCKERKEKP